MQTRVKIKDVVHASFRYHAPQPPVPDRMCFVPSPKTILTSTSLADLKKEEEARQERYASSQPPSFPSTPTQKIKRIIKKVTQKEDPRWLGRNDLQKRPGTLKTK